MAWRQDNEATTGQPGNTIKLQAMATSKGKTEQVTDSLDIWLSTAQDSRNCVDMVVQLQIHSFTLRCNNGFVMARLAGLWL
eukprot:15800392-Heterocapsa_arctica.AAC.1